MIYSGDLSHKWHKMIREEAICVCLIARRSPHLLAALSGVTVCLRVRALTASSRLLLAASSLFSRYKQPVQVLSDGWFPTPLIDWDQLSTMDDYHEKEEHRMFFI